MNMRNSESEYPAFSMSRDSETGAIFTMQEFQVPCDGMEMSFFFEKLVGINDAYPHLI
jgi:hypothetical protein